MRLTRPTDPTQCNDWELAIAVLAIAERHHKDAPTLRAAARRLSVLAEDEGERSFVMPREVAP
jgi:hypothetical protein